MRLVPKQLKWLGFGALAAWLFDPERGPDRRQRLSEQWSKLTDRAEPRVLEDHGMHMSAHHEMQVG